MVVVVGVAVLGWSPAEAGSPRSRDGGLDPSFGTGGLVTTDFFGDVDWGETAADLVVQRDSRLVAGGSVLRLVDGETTMDMALSRYNRNGTLDRRFGDGGRVTTDFFGDSWDFLSALVVQRDGKLVAAGSAASIAGVNGDFALVRYNRDGSLDPTFGTGGKVTTDFGAWESAYALALQADGKLVAVGFTDDGLVQDFALARYNTDGSLDPTFGTGGKVTTDFAGRFDFADAVVVLPDGRLVAAGATDTGTRLDFALARYRPDGTLDATFGAGGTVTTDFAGDAEHINDLVLQADGKLVAAGYTIAAGQTEFALARYDRDGDLDPRFGAQGTVVTDVGEGAGLAADLALQADGKLVAAGTAYTPSGVGSFALVRYNHDGQLDHRFGDAGMVFTDFGGSASANALVVQWDGRLVAAGNAIPPNASLGDFAVARYRVHGRG
jgi:uncharacterized delta-60 repeat protein